MIAAVRHDDTKYDELLMSGISRGAARDRVRSDVECILAAWRADGVTPRVDVTATDE